jgi:hypothetical protein
MKSTSSAAVSTVSSSATASAVYKFCGFLFGLPVRWRSPRSKGYAASSIATISAADSAVCEFCCCLYGLQCSISSVAVSTLSSAAAINIVCDLCCCFYGQSVLCVAASVAFKVCQLQF